MHEERFAKHGEYDEGSVRVGFIHLVDRGEAPFWDADDALRASDYIQRCMRPEIPSLSLFGGIDDLYGEFFTSYKLFEDEDNELSNPLNIQWTQHVPLRLLRDWWLAMDEERTIEEWDSKRVSWGSNNAYGDIARGFARMLNEHTCEVISVGLFSPFMDSYVHVDYRIYGRSFWSTWEPDTPDTLKPVCKEVAA